MYIHLTGKLERKALLDLIARSLADAACKPPSMPGDPLPSVAGTLTQLTDEERLQVAGAIGALEVEINDRKIAWALQCLTKRQRDDALLEALIAAGAPYDLIAQLSTLPYRAFKQLRARAGMRGQRGRRPLPPLRVQIDMVHAFRLLSRTQARGECFLQLHARFSDWSLASIFRLIQDTENVESSATTRPVPHTDERAQSVQPMALVED